MIFGANAHTYWDCGRGCYFYPSSKNNKNKNNNNNNKKRNNLQFSAKTTGNRTIPNHFLNIYIEYVLPSFLFVSLLQSPFNSTSNYRCFYKQYCVEYYDESLVHDNFMIRENWCEIFIIEVCTQKNFQCVFLIESGRGSQIIRGLLARVYSNNFQNW